MQTRAFIRANVVSMRTSAISRTMGETRLETPPPPRVTAVRDTAAPAAPQSHACWLRNGKRRGCQSSPPDAALSRPTGRERRDWRLGNPRGASGTDHHERDQAQCQRSHRCPRGSGTRAGRRSCDRSRCRDNSNSRQDVVARGRCHHQSTSSAGRRIRSSETAAAVTPVHPPRSTHLSLWCLAISSRAASVTGAYSKSSESSSGRLLSATRPISVTRAFPSVIK